MKQIIQSVFKKVTLELVYEAVDERAKGIHDRIDRFEHETSNRLGRLEDDVREIRSEMNRRFEAMEQKFEQRFASIDQKFASMDQKFASIDHKFDLLNARLDQIFAILAHQRREG